MEREEAIRRIKAWNLDADDMEVLSEVIPELKEEESDDERIKKAILSALRGGIDTEKYLEKHGTNYGEVETWLEKQKEQKSVECIKFDNEFENQISHLIASVLNGEHEYNEGFVKYVAQSLLGYAKKEQKPSEVDEYKIIKKHITEDSLSSEVNKRLTECGWYVTDEKPKKWSEEDEKKIHFLSRLIEFQVKNDEYCFSGGRFISKQEAIEMLKSLRPQPHKETYQAAKHDLAIRFMNYLDENRPEGKMCLSNEECEDIDKAFMENDWTKIMRYTKKYLIQSEQKSAEWSEEDELTIADLINYFEGDALECSTEEMVQRIKSLRPQSKQEWSEEDKHRCKDAIYFLETAKKHYASTSEIELTIKWLKSLSLNLKKKNEDVEKLCSNEWSEEDEKMRKNILLLLSCFVGTSECDSNPSLSTSYPAYQKEMDWLKSLPKRFNLQPQAKEEQKPEAKLTGWVARDREFSPYYGTGLVLFKGKPTRSGDCWTGVIDSQLPWKLFSDLKWTDEPIEVEVTIRKK